MKIATSLWIAIILALAGCNGAIPYRSGHYQHKNANDADVCRKVYADYDAVLAKGGDPEVNNDDECWTMSRETHKDYDLLVVEFDDQGWIQGASMKTEIKKEDHLSKLYAAVKDIRGNQMDGQPLSIVVFVHGWQHNAKANDPNVRAFRKVLQQVNQLESVAASSGPKRRVVGIYVGWRGESLTIPIINNLTFWERKNTAEKVSQGAVQELFHWLDWLRDTDRPNGEQYVNVLTIGHSFGGLITFEALNSEFVRNGVRFDGNPKSQADRYMSRVGDLVVIANPAFEGTRYESLRAVARRFPALEKNQLPVVVIATSKADYATRYAFPIARWFNTIFESDPGEQGEANLKAVGHNPRYITHELSLCKGGDCEDPCNKQQGTLGRLELSGVEKEYRRMKEIASLGFGLSGEKPTEHLLCDGLRLKWTAEAYPANNPYWVVRTTKDIMEDHNDIFNDNMIAFVRQMYTAFVAARNESRKEPMKRP